MDTDEYELTDKARQHIELMSEMVQILHPELEMAEIASRVEQVLWKPKFLTGNLECGYMRRKAQHE